MSVDRKVLGSALAALLIVSACGGSATPAPGASQTPAAAQSPAASQEAPASQEAAASEEPTASQEATESPEASAAPSQAPQGPGANSDLANTLPSTVNGVTFTKATIPGGIFPAGVPIGANEGDFGKFLADNGKSLSDVSIATATAAGATSIGTLVMAIQVKGVSSDKLLTLFQGSGDMPKASVGGKDVFGAALPGLGGTYLYPHGDTVYFVLSMGGDATMAEGILKQLP